MRDLQFLFNGQDWFKLYPRFSGKWPNSEYPVYDWIFYFGPFEIRKFSFYVMRDGK